jgi:CRISPR system Cascade subunit CasE
MYLSRLILNPRTRRVQREIAAPYQMHRSLMNGFPDDLAEGDERVLFRLESHPRTGDLTLLVQSLTLPDWSWLAEPGARGYLLPADVPNPASLNLAPGQTLTFRLRANPTVKRWVENEQGEKRPRRIGLYQETKQRAWLDHKAERGGFRVLSARTANQGTVNGRIQKNGTTHKLTLLAVQFDGLLQVTDPDRLRETVQRGVGSGKGMGFGLLSLARPS